MAKQVIVDMNSIGYAAHSATKLTIGKNEIQAVFGMTKTMRNMRTAFRGFDILGLWDGKTEWRIEECPEYKSNRDDKPEKVAFRDAYRAQRPLMAKSLELMGFKQMTVSTHEADDMAGYLSVELAKNPANEVVLVTGDKDWLQLVKPNVDWFDPIRDNRVSVKNFTDFTGYLTQQAFLEGKALQGDTSDVICGVGGIGEKGAPILLAEFGSVWHFFDQCDSGEFVPKAAAHKKLVTVGREIFKRNMRLMNLLDVPKPDPQDVKVVRGEFNEAGFREFCEKLQFHSILRDFDNFVRPLKA